MAETVLQIENISKSFGALRAISNLSLTVKMGEIHALIGPNGAGKTTLIQQVYGSSKPDRGTILLNGDEITNLTVSKRVRAGIGRSFQISNVLLDFTVFENAIIAELARLGQSFRFFQPAFADPVLKEGADLILDRVGLLPSKDLRVGDLSHGEKRVLELALALATKPKLLLLDEPMAGAGPEESRRMADIIEGLRENFAILLIEHDMDAVFRLASRLTVLVEGEIIATGTVAEISKNELVKSAYLGDD